jgi:hypothetical protein
MCRPDYEHFRKSGWQNKLGKLAACIAENDGYNGQPGEIWVEPLIPEHFVIIGLKIGRRRTQIAAIQVRYLIVADPLQDLSLAPNWRASIDRMFQIVPTRAA